MSKNIKYTPIWFLLPCMAIILYGCAKDNYFELEKITAPYCQYDHIELKTGEQRENKVFNCENFDVLSAPECIEYTSLKNIIIIKGLGEGKGTIALRANKQRLNFTVEVKNDDEDINMPAEEIINEFKNVNHFRIKSGFRDFDYDKPGTIFITEKKQIKYSAISLISGETISLTFPASIVDVDESSPIRYNINNGEEESINKCTIICEMPNTINLLLITSKGNYILAALEK